MEKLTALAVQVGHLMIEGEQTPSALAALEPFLQNSGKMDFSMIRNPVRVNIDSFPHEGDPILNLETQRGAIWLRDRNEVSYTSEIAAESYPLPSGYERPFDATLAVCVLREGGVPESTVRKIFESLSEKPRPFV